jgi:hypothetical protein
MSAAAPLLRAGVVPVAVLDELVLEPTAVFGCEELRGEESEAAELKEGEADDEESEPTLSEMVPPETAPGLTLREVFLAEVT